MMVLILGLQILKIKVGSFSQVVIFQEKQLTFFWLSHAINENLLFKLEYDSTLTPGLIGYEIPKEDFSFGIEYSFRDNFTIGFSRERGNYTSLKFIYKNNPKKLSQITNIRKLNLKMMTVNMQNL